MTFLKNVQRIPFYIEIWLPWQKKETSLNVSSLKPQTLELRYLA
jgi:hypothetical protein